MNDNNIALLCPKCRAVLFICTGEPPVPKDYIQSIAEGLTDGLIIQTMTDEEFRSSKYGFGCKCPKVVQGELLLFGQSDDGAKDGSDYPMRKGG